MDYDDNNHHSRDPSHGHTTLGATLYICHANKFQREVQRVHVNAYKFGDSN